jgi:hypothetical protein
LTISVSIQIKRRSGRKLLALPHGETGMTRPWHGEPTPLQLALSRGHRWLAMLESGEVKSLRELAQREGVDSSYVSRMINLTTLAPDIVAAILDEKLPPALTLFDLAVDPPALWEEQPARINRLSKREPLPDHQERVGVEAWNRVTARLPSGRTRTRASKWPHFPAYFRAVRGSEHEIRSYHVSLQR